MDLLLTSLRKGRHLRDGFLTSRGPGATPASLLLLGFTLLYAKATHLSAQNQLSYAASIRVCFPRRRENSSQTRCLPRLALRRSFALCYRLAAGRLRLRGRLLCRSHDLPHIVPSRHSH